MSALEPRFSMILSCCRHSVLMMLRSIPALLEISDLNVQRLNSCL